MKRVLSYDGLKRKFAGKRFQPLVIWGQASTLPDALVCIDTHITPIQDVKDAQDPAVCSVTFSYGYQTDFRACCRDLIDRNMTADWCDSGWVENFIHDPLRTWVRDGHFITAHIVKGGCKEARWILDVKHNGEGAHVHLYKDPHTLEEIKDRIIRVLAYLFRKVNEGRWQ